MPRHRLIAGSPEGCMHLLLMLQLDHGSRLRFVQPCLAMHSAVPASEGGAGHQCCRKDSREHQPYLHSNHAAALAMRQASSIAYCTGILELVTKHNIDQKMQ